MHTENDPKPSENMLCFPTEDELKKQIEDLEQRLAAKKRLLEEARSTLSKQTDDMAATLKHKPDNLPYMFFSEVNKYSSSEVKIALFRSLFRGREDVYARRFESSKTRKSGYRPVCRNEWVRGICGKPKMNCGNCSQRSFEPVTDKVIRNHLEGFSPAKNDWENPVPFVMGIYPLLQNETCYFLAMDFDCTRRVHAEGMNPETNTLPKQQPARQGEVVDKDTWREDSTAFVETCNLEGVPTALERSRSGNGAHVWIFFDNPVPASKARKLGAFLMTHTLDRRPEIGLDSFDRFFPNQDTLPKGGFGNLIALPLQKAAREKNHSVFLDDDMNPYADQWAFLASVTKTDEYKLDTLIQNAVQHNELLPVVYDPVEAEDDTKPWQKKSTVLPIITEALPQK